MHTYTQLHKAIAKHKVGDTVRIVYRTSTGATRTATVTLQAGPAD